MCTVKGYNNIVIIILHSNCLFFSRRRSEHTDRNVELKPTVLLRTIPTHLEIVITWCYRKPFHIVFPPCKVSNPTDRYLLLRCSTNLLLVRKIEI